MKSSFHSRREELLRGVKGELERNKTIVCPICRKAGEDDIEDITFSRANQFVVHLDDFHKEFVGPTESPETEE